MKFEDAIGAVRDRINIVDVVSEYVRLNRSGTNYKGLCPFHNDRDPSLCVSETKQIYKCFACGKAGNVYTFIQEMEGISFPEALKLLAKRVNIEIDNDFNYNKENETKMKKLYELYKDVANTYYKILYSDEGKVGLNYLQNRNLTKETIKKFGLGFSPSGMGKVYKMMKDKGYDEKLLLDDSKLFFEYENGVRDFFYNRVMFPLVDSHNHIVSFQGRVLTGNEGKYINTAESPIYKKSKNLFGINYAIKTKKDYFILCEGNMDVISLHQAGVDNAVAAWGTAFTQEQANLIKRKVKKLYLCLDSDAAGVKAMKLAVNICNDAMIDTYVVELSPAKDPDEFINKFGVSAFDERIKNAMPSFLYLIKLLNNEYDKKNVYDYEKYINTIVEMLLKIDNKIVRNKYIDDVCAQEGLDNSEIRILVEKNIPSVKITSNIMTKKEKAEKEQKDKKEKQLNSDVSVCLMRILLEHYELAPRIRQILNEDEFNGDECKYLYRKYLENVNVNDILDELNKEDDDFANSVKNIIFDNTVFNDENIDTENDHIKIALNTLIRKLKVENISKVKTVDFTTALSNNNKIKQINATSYI